MFLDGCFKGRDCLPTSLGPSFGSDALTSNHMKEMHMDEVSSLAHLILRLNYSVILSMETLQTLQLCILLTVKVLALEGTADTSPLPQSRASL